MTTELDTQTRGHHPHSPSSLQNSEACPHFVNHQSDSAASQAGVLQHKAAETRDLSILNGNAEQEEAVTRYIEQEDGWIAALRDAGAVSVEVIREQYLAVGGDVVLDEHGNPWTGITGGYPDLALIGTSYSADPRWGFEAALQAELSMDVLNLSVSGRGPFAAVDAALTELPVELTAARLVLWELPERYLTLEAAP
jgi:hypothetical protein